MNLDQIRKSNSPLGAMIKIVAIMLAVEFLIMLLIEGIFKPLFGHDVSSFFWEFLNPVFLVIIVTFALHILVLNPIKQQQLELEQQKNDLKIAAATFDAQEGVLVTDIYHNILKANQAFTNMTGYTSEEVIGKTPVILHSGRQDKEFYRNMLEKLKHDKSWKGEIWNRRKNGEIYPEWLTITTVSGEKGHVYYVGIFSDISQRKALEEKINFLAYHDQLTRLPSRALFYDRLSQAISQARRKHENLALFFLDLDGFKTINDDYGHEAGDEVLKTTAKRLLTCIRDIDTVCRLGGDEFAIVVGSINTPADLSLVAEKIVLNVNKQIVLQDGRECSVGVSMGIAIYPDDATEIDRLMSAADKAMYESKAGGKNIHTFAKAQTNTLPWIALDVTLLHGIPEMDHQHLHLADLLNKLNDAVINNVPTEGIALLLEEFATQIRTHFTDEESLMDECDYIDKSAHRHEHQRLLRELDYLKDKFNYGGELLVLQSLKEWLLAHVRGLDKQFADDFLLKKSA